MLSKGKLPSRSCAGARSAANAASFSASAMHSAWRSVFGNGSGSERRSVGGAALSELTNHSPGYQATFLGDDAVQGGIVQASSIGYLYPGSSPASARRRWQVGTPIVPTGGEHPMKISHVTTRIVS